MSAVNSNSDDRDPEAIRRAQRAHEPSMEEILASIRNIIAEEREPAQAADLKPAPLPPAGAPAPQIVYSKDASALHRNLTEATLRADANAPTVVWRRPQPAESLPAPDPVAPDEEPLLSSEANEAVSGHVRPYRLVWRRAAPKSRTAWCARCCVRCSSSG